MIAMLYRLVTMTKGKLLGQVVKFWSIIKYTEKKKKKKKRGFLTHYLYTTKCLHHVKYIQNPNQTIK